MLAAIFVFTRLGDVKGYVFRGLLLKSKVRPAEEDGWDGYMKQFVTVLLGPLS